MTESTTTLASAALVALEALLSTSPIVGVYAETGTGKTTFVASLMEDPRYRKVLYIDGDKGGATVAHLTRQAGLCDYRQAKGTCSLARQQWMSREISLGHKVPGISAVVIEGIARLYEDAVGEQFQTASPEDLSGNKLRRLYIIPSGLVKAVFSAVGNLQAQFNAQGRSVPIFLTVSTKEKSDDDGKTWEVPAISDYATKIIMGRADAFVQLVRVGKNVRIMTDRDQNTTHRKVRHAGAAADIAKLKNPTAPQLLQTWADAQAAQGDDIAQYLQTESTSQQQDQSS